MSDPDGVRLRDLAAGAVLVFSAVYFGVALAGPEGGCIYTGSDIGYQWDATVSANATADRVVVRNTGSDMGPPEWTVALLLRVQGGGTTATTVLARDHVFRDDVGLPFPSGTERVVTDVRVGGRDLRAGDQVTVVHRTSRVAPYCPFRDVDEQVLARTAA